LNLQWIIDGSVQQWALENKKANGVTVTTSNVSDVLNGSVMPTAPGNATNPPAAPTPEPAP
jgi:hypothetical protein